MVGDHYHDKWKEIPWIQPGNPFAPKPVIEPKPINTDWFKDYLEHQRLQVTREEFEKLQKQIDDMRKEVLDMKDLLKRAVEYDKRNNEPHCEMEEKVALLKKVAELFGVDLSDIFDK